MKINQAKLTEHPPREILSGKRRLVCVYILLLTTVKLNIYSMKLSFSSKPKFLSPWICKVNFNSQISRQHRFYFLRASPGESVFVKLIVSDKESAFAFSSVFPKVILKRILSHHISFIFGVKSTKLYLLSCPICYRFTVTIPVDL